MAPPFPLEIGYYRGGLQAVRFLTRALYNLIYDYPLIYFLPAPTMTRTPSSDDPTARLPPPPANKGHLLCLGWQTSLPILAGDNGNPTDGRDTIASPPHVRDDSEFLMALWDDGEILRASSVTGPRTTSPHLAVVVEGTLVVPGCLQENQYVGSYSSSEDDDSQSLLDLPEVLESATATASTTNMATALAPKDLEAVLAAVLESEHRRNCKFDANMTALHGPNIQVEQNLSDARGDIALICRDTSRLMTKSVALVEPNKATCLVVASSVPGQRGPKLSSSGGQRGPKPSSSGGPQGLFSPVCQGG